MTISEEKLAQLLTTLQKTVEELSASNARRDEMQDRMMTLLEENQALKREPHSPMNRSQEGYLSGAEDANYRRQGNRSSKHKGCRPTIQIDMDDMQWVLFTDAWERYKRIEELEDNAHICLELRDSCSPEVNQLLHDFIGPEMLNAATLMEEQLLSHIKRVAVKSIHVEVHQWHFANIKQTEGETITRFSDTRGCKNIRA